MQHASPFFFAQLAALAILAGGPALASELHVPPQGNDIRSGTKKEPFRTVERAKVEVQRMIAAGLREAVTVFLHKGVYEFREGLMFVGGKGTGPR